MGFIFSSVFRTDSTKSVSILITSALNCASNRLAISSSLSCIFFWSFEVFCHLGHFFVCLSWHVCYFKGRSLRCSLGRGNAGRCSVTLYVGEGPRGSNGARLTLLRFSIFHSHTHNQTGPLWCWFPSGWACAHSRPLWVSPNDLSCEAGSLSCCHPNPHAVFNQRFEALFPLCWSPGLRGLLRSPPFVRFICG